MLTTILRSGAAAIFAIDGVGSEGALMAWIPGNQFLWASDYIQSTARPSAYTSEVAAPLKNCSTNQ